MGKISGTGEGESLINGYSATVLLKWYSVGQQGIYNEESHIGYIIILRGFLMFLL